MPEKVVTVNRVNSSQNTAPVPQSDLPPVAGSGLVSILIPCCGQLEYTKLCVPSVLQQLLALVSMAFGIGMAGPMSNYAAPPQLVETVPYRVGPKKGTWVGGTSEWLLDPAPVYAFANQYREEHKGKWVEANRLGGFCLLLKREVLGPIGPLDEEGLGLFDTNVLSLKARQAGYSLAVCRDLFVHHFGTRTFAHGAPAAAAGN